MAKPPRRTCKICKEKFIATYDNVWWCRPEHGAQYALQELDKKREKQRDAKDKEDRSAWRKRKAAVKPLKHWEDLTQRVVNDYIRERDHELPCISCGTLTTVQWEAGHFRSRGKASHLRYVEDNINKQCHHCNVQLSGNQQQYRIRLIAKIGTERVEALENNNATHRYTIEELEAIRKHYSALRRQLIKSREAA
ncbi:recombination protein NinG [Enterobacter kobei]|uniref:recombination protein NinG n=1 Tax=Enterobacter kobei TaxID=208224 RepID=UPI0011ED0BF0|nr:recombination protein NinG [Enterobacter kobei]ELQ3772895.1 recombination protein NinG [Enterobacter kobei]QEO02520.1 recombination protein NinG [Enterobacter kobei]